MALLMEKGTEPTTESEIFDLDAISALKQSSAIELKVEEGNKYVKMGKKHFSDAIDCYTRAINQNALTDLETSLLYSNRAHVNLLLGNYRRALTDAEEAIKLSPSNVKAFYRAAKASLSLNLLSEAKSFGEKGLELDSSNAELDKLVRQIGDLRVQQDKREAEVNNAVAEAKELVSAFETRGLKMGVAMYQELAGLRKPQLDQNKLLHWPVLLLYAEVMSSDFIEDFCEIDMFSTHFDMMYSEPLDWDTENNYTREAIELYYEALSCLCRFLTFIMLIHQAGSSGRLPKTKVLKYLLEGTAGASLESEKDEKDTIEDVSGGKTGSRWVKVNEKRKLIDVIKEGDFIIPGIPVFYVVSKRSSFYETFRSGKWKLP
ncbi:Tetratricopeptide repeat protein 4 homolog [Linum grandiflorum]